jgi:hypothetical protein
MGFGITGEGCFPAMVQCIQVFGQNAIPLDVEGLAPFKLMDFSTLQKSTNALDCWSNSASQSLVSFVSIESGR